MRPPAIERMGYYPTATQVVELLKTYFKPAESGRLLDPCAGEGTAASILAKALNCQSWGAELSPARAALASEKMDRLFNAPWGSCHLTNESITLLFLNPPYSYDRLGDQKRLELEFLKSTTPKLVRGGALVYIVPHHLLGDLDVSTHLAGYYENLTVYRYPDTEFNQVIVLGLKRLKYKLPSSEEIGEVRAWVEIEPPMLSAVVEPRYILPPSSDKGAGGQPVRFTRLDWQPEEIVDATQKRGVLSTKEWLDLLNPTRASGEFKQPVMPLKKGHIAMMMASGMMGTLRLNDDDGKPMLVKGRVVKVTEKVEETTSRMARPRPRPSATASSRRWPSCDKAESRSLTRWSRSRSSCTNTATRSARTSCPPIARYITSIQRQTKLQSWIHWEEPASLSLARKRQGCFPPSAILRQQSQERCGTHGVGNIQGEMGSGKTQTGRRGSGSPGCLPCHCALSAASRSQMDS